MPIASALFAPAAPVSNGTTAAGMGEDMANAGLFSSKIASVLDAGVDAVSADKAAPAGRLTTARPLGLTLTQTVVEDAAASGPSVETASPSAPEVVDAKSQPDAGDEPVVGEVVAEADSAASPAAVALSPPPPPALLVLSAPSSTAPLVVSDDSGAQTVVDAASRVATAAQAEASVEQGRVSLIAPMTPQPLKASNDATSPDVSGPTDTSADLNAKATLSEGFALTAEAEAALLKGPDITAEAKAALPSLNTASAVSNATSKTEALVDAAPAQSPPVATPKNSLLEGASAPLVQSMAKTETHNVGQASVVAPEVAKTPVQTAPSDNAKAAAAPIAQAMTAAQIPTAQVQITVGAQVPGSAPLAAADIAAAVVAAELSIDAHQVASDQPADAAPTDKPAPAPSLTPQAAPPLRAARHELAQQTSNAATASAPTDATNGAMPPSAKIDTAAPQAPAQAAKTVEAVAASPSPPAPIALDAQAANAAPADAQSVQQAAAPSRDLGLSTLSRATVETTAQLAAQIARKLDGRSTRFDMVLTPEDLGRVDVQLEIGKDGQLSARLAFDNPAAAADLKGRADELRRQLQDAGFQVAGDALDFSQRDPSAGGGAFERQQQRNALFAGGSRLAAQADTPIIPAPGAWINHSQTPDRVDLKV